MKDGAPRQAPRDEGGEPADDQGEEDGDSPKNEPDEVGKGQEEAEEDGQPRATQIALDPDVHRLVRRRLGRGGQTGVGVRVAIGEKQRVAERLVRVPKSVGGEIAEAHGHPAEGETDEPAEYRRERDHADVPGEVPGDLDPPVHFLASLRKRPTPGPARCREAGESAREHERREGEEEPKRRLPAALLSRAGDLEVDRIAAGSPTNPGYGFAAR